MTPSSPHKIVEDIMQKLPDRPREVMVKRFGLEDGARRTLEAIGREKGITRERVRQIEEEGFRYLRQPDISKRLQPSVDLLTNYFSKRGNLVKETQIFEEMARDFGPKFADAKNYHPTLYFLLSYGDQFNRLSESPDYYARWTTDADKQKTAQKAISELIKELDRRKQVHTDDEILQTFRDVYSRLFQSALEPEALSAYIATSREIHRSPFGEFGLRRWPEVNPRGVRDKAFLVLKKLHKPLHFTEVAEEINRSGFGVRSAHPQTVHNELIKDTRFILVGRGTYALRDWGYEPGTVRDVLTKILKESVQPLTRDEIIEKIMKQRFVKPNTIILNLQNRNYFRRDPQGRYSLME